MKKIASAFALAVAAVAVVPGTAFASHDSGTSWGDTGRCEQAGSKICLYYNSNQAGAEFVSYAGVGHGIEIPNLAGYTYPGGGAGTGQAVKNNSASAANRMSPGCTLYVYYNSNYSGASDYLSSGSHGNLYNTYNNNASINQFC
ncbi:peptidase inhibitor family I36 protein [Kitasatospora sp. NPDC097605]|uniref:peptidase inhibitor family I36 protein n=1 Tax=Kitasatospora sp. NPDC097605 TaxID=3157226 RepID=UPI0033182151